MSQSATTDPTAYNIHIDRHEGKWRCWIAPIGRWCYKRGAILAPYGDTYWDDAEAMGEFIADVLSCSAEEMKERLTSS